MKSNPDQISPELQQIIDRIKANNPTLKEINLGRNQINNIGAQGVRHLGCALLVNTALETLHLGLNNIGVEGARLFNRSTRNKSFFA